MLKSVEIMTGLAWSSCLSGLQSLTNVLSAILFPTGRWGVDLATYTSKSIVWSTGPSMFHLPTVIWPRPLLALGSSEFVAPWTLTASWTTQKPDVLSSKFEQIPCNLCIQEFFIGVLSKEKLWSLIKHKVGCVGWAPQHLTHYRWKLCFFRKNPTGVAAIDTVTIYFRT